MDINKVISIVRRLKEEPERTADYKAMQASLYPRGSTVDSKQRGENATAHRVGGWKDPRKRDKKAKRNRGYGALKSKLMGEEGAPTMSMGGGGIAGSVEAGDEPPVNKKKKKNIYLGLHSRKRWLDYINGKGSGKS